MLGRPWAPLPPLLLEGGVGGSHSPHHVPLGLSPLECCLGVSSVSGLCFSGADCKPPRPTLSSDGGGVSSGGKWRERWGSLTQV